MNILTFSLVILAFFIPQDTGSSTGRFTGCPSPDAIAQDLTPIVKSNWQQVTPERVLAIWPNQFDELKCESIKPCRLLVSKSRVIDGHCECCETFQFDIEPRKEQPSVSTLRNIIIHYSAAKRMEVVDAAKKLARAAGLPEAKANEIGTDSVQRYEWSDSAEGMRQSYLGELQFTKLSGHWELYFSLTAYAQ